MNRVLSVLPLCLAVVAAACLGAVIGVVSDVVYVLGLGALVLGITAAAAVSVTSLTLSGQLGRGALGQAAVAIVVGWLCSQVAIDRAFIRNWGDDFASARQAAAGVSPEAGVGDDELAFYMRGSQEALDDEVRRVVGVEGFLGRWLLRADAGVRLVGPASGGRGLAVGREGAIVWALLEQLLALFIAHRVLRRVRASIPGHDEVVHEF